MFRAQFPQVQFRIEEAPSAELDRKLLEGEIDLAFYMSFARHPGLSYRVLRRDRMYAVFGKGHPLEQAAAREGSFAWEWLEGQTLLLQNQTQRQGQYILQELRSRRLHPAEILEAATPGGRGAGRQRVRHRLPERRAAGTPEQRGAVQRVSAPGLHPPAGVGGSLAGRELSAPVRVGVHRADGTAGKPEIQQ